MPRGMDHMVVRAFLTVHKTVEARMQLVQFGVDVYFLEVEIVARAATSVTFGAL